MGQTRRPFLLGSDTTLDPSKHYAELFEVTVRPWGRAPETEPVRGSVAAGGGAQSGTHCGQGSSRDPGELPAGQPAPEPHR